jgi:hypothetical protein
MVERDSEKQAASNEVRTQAINGHRAVGAPKTTVEGEPRVDKGRRWEARLAQLSIRVLEFVANGEDFERNGVVCRLAEAHPTRT